MNKLIVGTLLLLTLFVSGGTSTTVIVEPLPTAEILVIIDDLTVDFDYYCYNGNYNDEFNYTSTTATLTDDYELNIIKVTETKTYEENGINIIKTISYPTIDYIYLTPYINENSFDFCESKYISIDFYYTEFINNIQVNADGGHVSITDYTLANCQIDWQLNCLEYYVEKRLNTDYRT